jgi:hypothetical protein
MRASRLMNLQLNHFYRVFFQVCAVVYHLIILIVDLRHAIEDVVYESCVFLVYISQSPDVIPTSMV